MEHARTRGTRRIAPIAVLGIGLVVASCDWIFGPRAKTIAKHPERYNGQVITVAGKVKERIDLPRGKCYIVDDGSGLIGVVTKGPMPSMGAKVKVQGRVDASFKLGKRPMIAIIAPDPAPTPRPAAPLPSRMPG